MGLTKQERFSIVLSGKTADRPLVSGWHHFLDKEHTAKDLAEATVAFQKKYDWDWIKINPRATYLAEAFGNEYDFSDYEWVFPKITKVQINTPEKLAELKLVDIATNPYLQEQIEVVKQLKKEIPEVPLVPTVFSPLSILLFLIGNHSYVNQTWYGSEKPLDFKELLETHRSEVHRALHVIAMGIAEFVSELESLGTEGLFYATTGTIHPELFSEEEFNEFSRPYDLIVLHAVKANGRILHTCGSYAKPEFFNDYPAEAISWDPDEEGNPAISTDTFSKVKIAGVDHHIFDENHVEEIQKQAQEALDAHEGQPFSLAPNCAVNPDASEKALTALREAIQTV